jgi:ABC-type dipeptide/oligopeptide/nickel transport system permease subunit
MIADGRDLDQLRRAPWTSVFPGMAIGAAVLGFNLLGDALRDALDPRQHYRPKKDEEIEVAPSPALTP